MILTAAAAFDRFDADSDPYGGAIFGALEIGGERVLRRIDYFDRT